MTMVVMVTGVNSGVGQAVPAAPLCRLQLSAKQYLWDILSLRARNVRLDLAGCRSCFGRFSSQRGWRWG